MADAQITFLDEIASPTGSESDFRRIGLQRYAPTESMSTPFEHWQEAKSVCVIGAGTMGSGIAAHLANLGLDVTLLDLTQESARDCLSRAEKAKPPHFYAPNIASRVRLGSVQDNLDWASEVDWVCEAIVEKLDLKRDLFARLDTIIRPEAMISTNTSGLEISLLAEGRSDGFKKRFLGTHFFNPPRYLKLLELIPTPETDPGAITSISKFLEDRCGRRVVLAKDTPGFIANRFGMWSMFHAIHVAEKLGLSIEQVDAICGPFLGRPRSGAFRLNDIVGFDIMLDIARNLIERCVHDPHMDTLRTPQSVQNLVDKGHLGAKSGAGYYKKEGKELLAYDLQTGAYRQLQEVSIPSLSQFAKQPFGERLKNALASKDEAGEFLRLHLIPVLQYANYLKSEISHSVEDFDRVMRWGFAWDHGPFETIDAIGGELAHVSEGPFYTPGLQLGFEGNYVPTPVEPHYAPLSAFDIVDTKETFNIRDLGDGILAISLRTKMGTINPTMVTELRNYLADNESGRFVLTSEGKHFSAGFDLQFFLDAIQNEAFESIDLALSELQQLTVLISRRHIVAAPFGYCLGAGTELAMACPLIVAHPESNIGLPEMKVGLLPGGAGATRAAWNAQSSGAKRVVEVCMKLGTGFTSTCAHDAQQAGLLRETDVVGTHPDRLLFDAKQAAMSVRLHAPNAWSVPSGPIGGMIDQEQKVLKAKGDFSDHDELIADKIKHVFTKPTSFEDALRWERIGFIELCRNGLTVARIKHMLETNKPLRN